MDLSEAQGQVRIMKIGESLVIPGANFSYWFLMVNFLISVNGENSEKDFSLSKVGKTLTIRCTSRGSIN